MGKRRSLLGLCALAVPPVLALLPFAGAAVTAQTPTVPPAASRAPVYHYAIVHSYPHDPDAFTEGLEYRDGFLYESTGLNGKSSLRKVRIETGDVVQQRNISRDYFGEGITFWKDDLFELTWITEIAFVYDAKTFASKTSFAYKGEGWALTHNADSLVMSDGGTQLRFLDPSTFRERKRITVTDGGVPIKYLNELEWVKGEILANVYTTDYIARIDPSTGHVTGWIDIRGMLPRQNDGNTVPNGIAYDAEHDRLFVTGKNWPKLFEIRLTR
ncbi:MAG TPA: glutaminyl-peptide cyclotransferase [Vicinamibacterales bacterium]|nr:glutaminyl-peptide cyclotransferase [Vicinamibacterales bacterium]